MKLYFSDYGKHRRIHFVGIGGVSMSALAEIMNERGHIVTGSDISSTEVTDYFMSKGVGVMIGHNARNVQECDLVVYTAAVPKDNVELVEAERLGIPIVERATFLGYILQGFECPIGIAGTHGKTTTTSMISQVMLSSNMSPTVLLGGTLPYIGHNYKVGSSPYVVYEACEYVDSFLNFQSRITVLLNVDNDHLEYFKTMDAVKKSFFDFASLTMPGGVVIANKDDKNLVEALDEYHGKIAWMSLVDREAEYYADIVSTAGAPSVDFFENGEYLGQITLKVPGEHNVKNALAAVATARYLNVDFNLIKTGLEEFVGAKRRFERKGMVMGAEVIDDYAHHPTEIRETIKAAKSMGIEKLWCVFQPHTYSRTKEHFDDFVKELAKADEVILLDIFAAREAKDDSITSKMLADKIKNAKYFASFDEAVAHLRANIGHGDVIMTMGAGNVYKLGEALLEN